LVYIIETCALALLLAAKLGFTVMLDPQPKVADYFGTTNTPDTFLIDSSGHTLYKGAIDNWAPELGQHRSVLQEKGTPAVGCFIERKNPG
jgi:hypothetical protein